MTIEREPLLTPVAVKDLRPTQITVGMREVTLKRQMIRAQSAKKTGTFLGNHMIPVVLGPKKKNYVIDHHHL
ncbi:MAG: chromosome partitioning protein ParB, partial [Mesorhizobium sp.]|nr:chromosome partitioning protein ParB [Mesorhizobium sp.]